MKSSLKITLFAFSCLLFNLTAQAQFNNNQSNGSWRFGGSFGGGFAENESYLLIAPSVVYDQTDWFSYGSGLSYYSWKGGNSKVKIIGANVFTLLYPFPELEIVTELEMSRVNQNAPYFKQTYWTPALYLGAGYSSGTISYGLKYNLIHNEKSLYDQALIPFIRILF